MSHINIILILEYIPSNVNVVTPNGMPSAISGVNKIAVTPEIIPLPLFPGSISDAEINTTYVKEPINTFKRNGLSDSP
ncbi:MAG UNVERIFIED_CONTAM: hypothetical protein LVR29_05165 [Microcystis novacekii LVE1205-3]|jgi:hypothetical protein